MTTRRGFLKFFGLAPAAPAIAALPAVAETDIVTSSPTCPGGRIKWLTADSKPGLLVFTERGMYRYHWQTYTWERLS